MKRFKMFIVVPLLGFFGILGITSITGTAMAGVHSWNGGPVLSRTGTPVRTAVHATAPKPTPRLTMAAMPASGPPACGPVHARDGGTVRSGLGGRVCS